MADDDFLTRPLTPDEEFLLWKLHAFPTPENVRALSDDLAVKMDYLTERGYDFSKRPSGVHTTKHVAISKGLSTGLFFEHGENINIDYRPVTLPSYLEGQGQWALDHIYYVQSFTGKDIDDLEEIGDIFSNLWDNNATGDFQGTQQVPTTSVPVESRVVNLLHLLQVCGEGIEIPVFYCLKFFVLGLLLLQIPALIFVIAVLVALSKAFWTGVGLLVVGLLFVVVVLIWEPENLYSTLLINFFKSTYQYAKSIYDIHHIRVFWQLNLFVREVKSKWF